MKSKELEIVDPVPYFLIHIEKAQINPSLDNVATSAALFSPPNTPPLNIPPNPLSSPSFLYEFQSDTKIVRFQSSEVKLRSVDWRCWPFSIASRFRHRRSFRVRPRFVSRRRSPSFLEKSSTISSLLVLVKLCVCVLEMRRP